MDNTTPPVLSDASTHLDNLQSAQASLATKQVHPASPEGKVFQIILDALQFLLTIFHHASAGTVPPVTLPPAAAVTPAAPIEQPATEQVEG